MPVLTKNKSRSKTFLNGNQQRILKAQIRDSVHNHNGTTGNNSKVDQIIADLLIEALNHSTDIGIEFIQTPQNPASQSNIKLSSSKRMNLSTRRTSNGPAISGSGKRSAQSSAKYQQVFDAIPEEKSGSLSLDSPIDENGITPVAETSIINSDENVASSTKSVASTKINNSSTPSKNSKDAMRKSPSKSQANGGAQSKVASGKAAIESDQDKSETWFGCFGRTHIDSPVDGLLMDEGILKIMHNTSLAV